MNEFNPKGTLLSLLGLAFCIIPAASAAMMYFPLWIERGAASTLSGFSLFVIILAFIPLLKFIRGFLRTPSSYVMWLTAFIIFALLSSIADEMTVICFVGFVGNLIGAVLLKYAKKYNRGDGNDE